MDPVVIVHVLVAAALVTLAAVVGVWGLVRSGAIATSTSVRESRLFGHLLQLSHTLVLATGMLGLALLTQGHRPDDPLHTRVYGPFMVIAVIAAYGYRTANARANVRVFAGASLVIFALGLRALVTGS